MCPFWKLPQKTHCTRWVTRLPLSPPPQSLPLGLLNNVVAVAGMEAVRGLHDRDFTSPKPTWLPPLLRAELSNSRDQRWTPLPGAQPATVHGHGHSECLTLHDGHPAKLPWIEALPPQEKEEGSGFSGPSVHHTSGAPGPKPSRAAW